MHSLSKAISLLCKWILSGSRARANRAANRSRSRLRLEALEDRTTPSSGIMSPFATSSPGDTAPLSPQDIRSAYGVNSITFTGGVVGNGAGQTIAIVDAFDDPRALADLQTFDARFGLNDPPSFIKVNQSGQPTSYPATDPIGRWELEESLDIEWSHALAPAANIVLVEATNSSTANLFAAVQTAESLSGVTVVSMSWGNQGGFAGETGYDYLFTKPGVTFVASTGDSGSPGSYPAESPYVLAIGGTTLTLINGSAYGSEVAWNKSGGGLSQYESRPSYQDSVRATVGNQRGTPDVSFDANPNSGVSVYDSFKPILNGGSWVTVGGTSLGAPAWAGLIAIADQGRGALGTLSSSQTLSGIYAAPASDFHDILNGNNGGYKAGVGYDLVTGLGTPVANLLASAAGSSTTAVVGSAGFNLTSNLRGSIDSLLSTPFQAAATGSTRFEQSTPDLSAFIHSTALSHVEASRIWIAGSSLDGLTALAPAGNLQSGFALSTIVAALQATAWKREAAVDAGDRGAIDHVSSVDRGTITAMTSAFDHSPEWSKWTSITAAESAISRWSGFGWLE